MKNLLFAFIAAFAMLSCSDDSGSSNRDRIVMTVNGEEVIFTNINAVSEDIPADGESPAYSEITVSAVANGNLLSFFIIRGETGPDRIYGFYYMIDDVVFNGELTSDVTKNDGSHLKGTFSGSLLSSGIGAEIIYPVTNGSFDIRY